MDTEPPYNLRQDRTDSQTEDIVDSQNKRVEQSQDSCRESNLETALENDADYGADGCCKDNRENGFKGALQCGRNHFRHLDRTDFLDYKEAIKLCHQDTDYDSGEKTFASPPVIA